MNSIDGLMFKAMVTNGYRDLMSHYKHVDELNVFPVPDGDTGTNMGLTVNGALQALEKIDSTSLEVVAEAAAQGMLLSARGNSGVILSQFFAGLAEGLKGFTEASVIQFAQAMENGVKAAYSVVVKPVEGTILTVMREGVEFALNNQPFYTSYSDYFTALVKKMKSSLDNTPELLPILKEAGVIDSGGAGLVYIIEGMAQAIGGRIIEDVSFDFQRPAPTQVAAAFTADSKLDYGYCTEFILQLSNEKEGPKNFDINQMITFLQSIGSSIVAFQKGTLVKVHVHTKTPDKAIAYAQKYGEFVTFKMENMALQHNETLIEKSRYIASQVRPSTPHAPQACVAVVPSEELAKQFKDYGVTVCINGGETNSPGAEDFLSAYRQANADDIIVLPNNKNSVMAAVQAGKIFGEEHVHVIESDTLVDGYAAASIMDLADFGLEDNIQRMKAAIAKVESLAFVVANRDALLGGVQVTKGEYIGLLNNEIKTSEKTLLGSFRSLAEKVADFDDKEVATIFLGKSLKNDDKTAIIDYLNCKYPFLEVYEIDAKLPIYDLVIALE